MSGLAKLFQSSVDAEYIAGVWSDKFLGGLSWQGLDGQAPFAEYTGPSWSWAAYDGTAALPHSFFGWTDIAVINGWNVEPKDRSNPFGEVKPGAWVKLHGPMTDLTLSTKEAMEHEIRLRRADIVPLPRFCTCYSKDETGTQIVPDHEEFRKSKKLQAFELRVMILAGMKSLNSQLDMMKADAEKVDDAVAKEGVPKPFETFIGLVIQKLEQGQHAGSLKRIGRMSIDRAQGYRILEDKENWKTVTLV